MAHAEQWPTAEQWSTAEQWPTAKQWPTAEQWLAPERTSTLEQWSIAHRYVMVPEHHALAGSVSRMSAPLDFSPGPIEMKLL